MRQRQQKHPPVDQDHPQVVSCATQGGMHRVAGLALEPVLARQPVRIAAIERMPTTDPSFAVPAAAPFAPNSYGVLALPLTHAHGCGTVALYRRTPPSTHCPTTPPR